MSHRIESGQEAQGRIVGSASSTCWWYCPGADFGKINRTRLRPSHVYLAQCPLITPTIYGADSSIRDALGSMDVRRY